MTTAVPKQTGMNEQEFEELFRKYRQLVYRAAYTVTGRRQDAEDALQTLFLRLLDQGFSLEFIRNPEGYLYRTAVNEARQMFRARKRRNHTEDDVEALQDPETDRYAGHNHMRERLLEAMAQLEPEQAEMLVLCYEHGYSDAQIAEMLGRKRDAVAMTLNRARARLKELMGEESKEVDQHRGIAGGTNRERQRCFSGPVVPGAPRPGCHVADRS